MLAYSTLGQGFVYDQQSSMESNVQEGSVLIQFSSPLGQSFTPSLSAVGFVRLYLYDANLGNSIGASVMLNLRSSSITGPILGSPAPVAMPDNFVGLSDFFFLNAVPVTPGQKYFLEAIVQSDDSWVLNASNYSYPGGSEIYAGSPLIGNNLWFREGLYIVPEPSTALLVILGVALLILRNHLKKRQRQLCKGSP
jgi:hypothetical protein